MSRAGAGPDKIYFGGSRQARDRILRERDWKIHPAQVSTSRYTCRNETQSGPGSHCFRISRRYRTTNGPTNEPYSDHLWRWSEYGSLLGPFRGVWDHMVCSHIHAEPLRDRLKGLNELGVKTPLISNNSILLPVILLCVSLSEYGTYHMLCGIGVWYRGILTSTSTSTWAQYRARYRCIPKIFCNIINVFIIIFDQFKASVLGLHDISFQHRYRDVHIRNSHIAGCAMFSRPILFVIYTLIVFFAHTQTLHLHQTRQLYRDIHF